MKQIILLLLITLLASTSLSQEKLKENIIDDGKTLLADINNLSSYRKFVAHYREVPAEYLQKMIAIGILGARVFKLEKEFNFFAKYLQKNFPSSKYLETVHLKNLSDTCQACNGQGSAPRQCAKCKGAGACTNNSCSEGQVTGYDRVNGRFVVVQRTCIICKGGGKCNSCEGSGESVGSCTKCRKAGYVYSEAKAIETYEAMIREVVDQADKSAEAGKQQEMAAKGMVEIDGEWYTKEQVAQMEKNALEARKKADEAERRAMEVAEAEKKRQAAAGILSQVDSLLKENPGDAVTRLKSFLADYPNHEKAQEVRKELQYCDLYIEAVGLEEKGAISKAIKKYREVLKFKNSEDVLRRIKKLDEQTIGL